MINHLKKIGWLHGIPGTVKEIFAVKKLTTNKWNN